MNILFVHRDYPGQFGAIADRLARSPHHRVAFINSVQSSTLNGIQAIRAQPRRKPAATTHHYLHSFEADVLMGQAVYEAGIRLRQGGFMPDVILGHCGWGATLYLREAFPAARFVGYFEWYYHPRDSDADFLDPAGMTPDNACRIRSLNAPILMTLEDVDFGIVPTEFQRRQFPIPYQQKLTTLHDGVDTEYFCPSAPAFKSIGGHDFGGIDKLVTYATRGLEPYRGFPHFMRALDGLLRRDKAVHVAIAGEDRSFYSRSLPNGETYKEMMLRELQDLPRDRVHFVGTLPRDEYRNLLRLSSLHVYLTVPFVPSWSLVEAMSCGCHIVASDTIPVREVIGNTSTAHLTDFRDVLQLEEVMYCALGEQEVAAKMRGAARRRAKTAFSSAQLLPIWEQKLTGSLPSPALSHNTKV
jgi:glycosyltransferase involved in cell wall biosynthesis